MNIFSFSTGVNLTLFNLNEGLKSLTDKFENFKAINLGKDISIMVADFLHENNIKTISTILSTGSEFPHDLLTASIELLKREQVVFIGTFGLSFESTAEICMELVDRYSQQEKIIFICCPRLKNSDNIEILKLDQSYNKVNLLEFLKKQ